MILRSPPPHTHMSPHHSLERDSSPLSDQMQMVQTAVFQVVQDLLKSPLLEEMYSLLAFSITTGEEFQVRIS